MMIKQITIATTNKGKLDEFMRAFKDFPIEFKALDFSFNCTEDGETFLENAALKAQMASRLTNAYCLGDDSGLCVEAVNGQPGLFSARYFENGQGIHKILEALQCSNERQAHFVCALVLSNPQGQIIWQDEKKWFGAIAEEAKGDKGFGYDPIFIPNGFNYTVGEMEPLLKERISHRGQVIEKLKIFLLLVS